MTCSNIDLLIPVIAAATSPAHTVSRQFCAGPVTDPKKQVRPIHFDQRHDTVTSIFIRLKPLYLPRRIIEEGQRRSIDQSIIRPDLLL
jgi:hypothetical protein